MSYPTLEHAKSALPDWFSWANDRYFQRKYETDLISGAYFIVSTLKPKQLTPQKRRHTIYRILSGDTEIELAGEFEQHSSLSAAKLFLKHQLGVPLVSFDHDLDERRLDHGGLTWTWTDPDAMQVRLTWFPGSYSLLLSTRVDRRGIWSQPLELHRQRWVVEGGREEKARTTAHAFFEHTFDTPTETPSV